MSQLNEHSHNCPRFIAAGEFLNKTPVNLQLSKRHSIQLPTMVGELANHLGVTASTMSLNLTRLEKAGYISRERDPADRRVMNVLLTESGERLRSAQTMLDPERVHRLLHEMDLETRRNALHGLMLLSDAADALIRRRWAFADAANQGGVL